MKQYLINLDRRPDRLAAMQAEARKRGLSFTRIAALDGGSPASEALAQRWFAPAGPLGPLSLHEKCCALSHRIAWSALVDSGEDHAVVMEDDVRLGPGAALLGNREWIPPGIDLIKLEHFGPENQRVLVAGQRRLEGAGVSIGRIASRHTGAAAYLLSRRAAQRLLTLAQFNLPVDHLLFNPNISPVFADLAPWQMMPPLARQRDFVGEKSDLEPARRPLRRFSPAYVKREIVRGAYEWKLVPRQLLLLLSGRASLVAIGRIGAENSLARRAAAMPAE
jgi:glycosyl transferase, family 25